MKTRYVLIVDDEPSVLSALQRSIRHRFGGALRLVVQTDAQAALDGARVQDYEVVISDLRMPSMDGLTLLRRMASLRPQAIRMILTGSADFETAQRAINDAGIFRYLCKPWQDDELAAHLQAALDHAESTRRQHEHAQAWQDQRDTPTPQERERRRLEALEPGITSVDWGPNGEVLMPPLLPTFGDD